jgi:hypothetical protein
MEQLSNKKNNWEKYLPNDWTTYLAYELNKKKENTEKKENIDTLYKYEALLTQCSYLSRMAYCPADIFCRMTEHLDVLPYSFNDYLKSIEDIYDDLFKYKCSYNSKYIQTNPKFIEKFNPYRFENSEPKKNGGGNGNGNTSEQQNKTETFKKIKNSTQIGYFIKNEKKLNAYIYLHHDKNSNFNNTPTLYISFKGSSNFKDFGHDLKSAVSKNIPLSQLVENSKNVSNVSNGKASSVFINILKESISQLCEKVIKLIKPDKETNLNNALKQQQISQQETNNNIFLNKLKNLNKLNKLKKLNNLKLRIIITGHSLGGALAELFGYYLNKYESTKITCPIHIITFGACCVFDAAGRNEFNSQLNISGPNVFTLDRITANADPIVLLPAHLDHGGYTLLKSSINELKAFTKTGRTNEIGEIRKMLGLEQGTSKENYDGNELLVSHNFLELFKTTNNFIKNIKYNFESYKKKYRRNIKPFSNKQNKQNKLKIKKEAMPNLKEQKAGEPEPQSTEFKKNTKLYKEKTLEKMPNQINYSCYKSITLGFCHGMYMGVSYMNVLRLIGDKDPVEDYILYKTNNKKIFSLPKESESFNFTNKNCSLLKNRIKMKIGAKKKNSQNLSSSNPKSEQSNSSQNQQSTSPQKAQSGFSCSIL